MCALYKDRYTLLFFLLLLSARGVCAVDFDDPHNWHRHEITDFLESAPIASCTPFSKEHGLHRVTFEGSKVQALFKTSARPQESDAEVLAFQLSKHWNNVFVPPAVLRKIDGKPGSLHLFVDSLTLTDEDAFVQALGDVPKENVDATKLFCFVLGQWDTALENFLLKKVKGRIVLIAIDFANIWQCQRGHYGTLPYVMLGGVQGCSLSDDFPFDEEKNVPHPTRETLEAIFETPPHKALDRIIERLIRDHRPNNWLMMHDGNVWQQYYRLAWNPLNKDALYDQGLGLMPAYVPHPSGELLQTLKQFQSIHLSKIAQDSAPAWIPHWMEHVKDRLLLLVNSERT